MERNNFKERCDVRMAALNLTQDQLGEIVGKPRQRLTEAFRGDKTPAALALRVTIDQALIRLVGEKRREMAEEIKQAAPTVAPQLSGEISLILPEDMQCIVTEDGVPVGVWNPTTKSYREF